MTFRAKVLIYTLFLTVSLALADMGKLGPRVTKLLRTPNLALRADDTSLRKLGDTFTVDVILTVQGELQGFRATGGNILCRRGDIAVARIPVTQLETVADLPSVIYMQTPVADRAYLDKSTEQIKADQAQSVRGLTGRDVILGIVDSGIDWGHHDFRWPNGNTRIKYLLDLSEPGNVYGGTVYTESDINDALNGLGFIDQVDISGHGTHVTGIAASDGTMNAGLGRYAGVAPEADLVIVKATRDQVSREFLTVDQILALTFIDSVAAVLNKPYVANLSLGGHSGAHDGTSPTERFIDNLVGPGIPGKAVVTVAGNDGDVYVHGKTSLDGSSGDALMSFVVESYRPSGGDGNDRIILNGWYDGTQRIGVTLETPSGNQYGPVLPSQVKDWQTSEGDIYIWNGFYEKGDQYQPGVNPLNGDREFYIEISDESSEGQPAAGEWILRYSGSGGTIDAWIANSTMNVEFSQGKTEEGRLSIPGTSKNVITVAAYVSKRTWEDVDGNNLTFDPDNEFTVGDIAGFSSPGPVRKGDYIKPEITAPGQILVSTLSIDAPADNPNSIFNSGNPSFPNALINQDGEHGLNSGTSMAAPHVAGAVALILDQNPDLTAPQIKSMLTSSARVDNVVGSVPNTTWGWGKLDVLAALAVDPEDDTPRGLALLPASPNPFINSTEIRFQIPLLERAQPIEISLYNTLGQHVRTLLNDRRNAGDYSIFWDGTSKQGVSVGSGVYFIRLKTGGMIQTEKVVFLGSK